MNWKTRAEVLKHFEVNRRRVSPEQREALIRLYEAMPEEGHVPTRCHVAQRFRCAWRLAKLVSTTPDERRRRLAAAVAAALGLSDVPHVRAVHRLYLAHGMTATNRAALDLASSDFEPIERFRLLESWTKDRACSAHGCAS